jgi:hypothetical protein
LRTQSQALHDKEVFKAYKESSNNDIAEICGRLELVVWICESKEQTWVTEKQRLLRDCARLAARNSTLMDWLVNFAKMGIDSAQTLRLLEKAMDESRTHVVSLEEQLATYRIEMKAMGELREHTIGAVYRSLGFD